MTIGNFDILSGATEFLTVNTNANSRVSSSLNYQYTLGGNPYTSSAFQKNNTIQMVTGSNTRNNPENEGILTGTPTFTLEPQINRTGVGTFMLTNLPLTTIGGPGKGAECFVQFSTSGGLFGSTVTISNSKSSLVLERLSDKFQISVLLLSSKIFDITLAISKM